MCAYLKKLAQIISLTVAYCGWAMAMSLSNPAYADQDFAIFSLSSDFQELSQTKARKLYRGKTKRLDGNRIELSDWPEDSAVREEFYASLLGKNTAQMNAYWASLSFSGKARPPKQIEEADVSALVAWMKEDPHRIGYAPLDKLPDNATILYVVSTEN